LKLKEIREQTLSSDIAPIVSVNGLRAGVIKRPNLDFMKKIKYKKKRKKKKKDESY
tara:strand:+ start:1153 stop:1320 length:168 start_codon:yes stop_codon:yes gene_type:complete